MRAEIDFYGKLQVSIRLEVEDSQSAEEELVFFAWFTLRQLHNISHNPAGDVLAGLLVSDDVVNLLLTVNPQIPPAVDLFVKAQNLKFDRRQDRDAFWKHLEKMVEVQVRANMGEDPTFSIIDRDFFAAIPQFIRYPNKVGDKRYVAVLPPGQLDMKGFGILGRDANYYACHSIIALLRLLVMRRLNNDSYNKSLTQIGYSCAKAHMLNLITMLNQKELAVKFVVAAT